MVRILPVTRQRPFLLETGLSNFIDKLLADFDDARFEFAPGLGKTDIYEKDGALFFETELPGMKKEDVQVNVKDGRLFISGETKRDEEIKRENYFRLGRDYGRFQRCFPIPEQKIEKDGIKARLVDGILRVTVPLKDSVKDEKKAIEIKVD
jgi:HSP20 family protein